MIKSRILIVEDEAIVARDLTQQLETLGYEVAGQSATGEEALILAERLRPNLVLMDIQLAGGIDGIEVARTIRERFAIPVVFLTAFAGDGVLQRAKLTEPFGYILKPFEERELGTVLEMALYKHEAEQRLRNSREEMAVILQTALDGFWLLDMDGLFLEVNEAFCRGIGYAREELVGHPVSKIVSEYGPEEMKAHLAELKQMGCGRFERIYRAKQGALIHYEVSVNYLPHSGGRLFFFLRDITIRKQLEDEREITLRILSEINAHSDLRELMKKLTLLLRDWSGCEAVGIRLQSGGDYPYFETSGFEPAFVEKENQLCLKDTSGQTVCDARGNPILECMCGNVLSGRFDPALPFFTAKGSFWTNSTTELLRTATPAELQTATRNRCQSEGFESVALIPLSRNQTPYGLLQFNDGQRGRFTPERIALMERLADSLATAIAHRQAQEEIVRSEALLADAQRLAHLGHWKREAGNRHLWWSEEVYRIFGRSPESFKPTFEAFYDCIHPDDQALVLQEIQAAWRGEKTYSVDHRIIQPSGAVRHVHQRGEILSDSTGQPMRMLGTVLDITERKEAEATMRQQAALLEVAHDAILVQDLRGNILFMNLAAEKITGWTYEEAKARNIQEVLVVPHAISWQAASQETLEKGLWVGELTFINRQLKQIQIDSRWTLVRDEKSQPKAVLLVNTDMTEANRLKNQFLRAQRLESVGILASGIAHDLNNILSPILMGLGVIKEESGSSENKALISMILDCARRGADTVKQLLTFARGAESQKGIIQPRHLLKEMGQLLQRTFPKNIQIYTDFSDQPWVIMADPSQIHQVLMNLSVNARDAMPEGGILYLSLGNHVLNHQTLRLHPRAKTGPYVVFKVADSGSGIPPAIIERIFDPFFTTKPLGQGTGLGLSTVIGIVEHHDGFVLVDSEMGHGSTFSVYLPALPETEPTTTQIDTFAIRTHLGQTILIVDDEPAILKVTTGLLSSHGFQVLTANNAREAFELFSGHRATIQLVMTDLMMPFEDGQQLISRVRSVDGKIPILVMSGLATPTIKSGLASQGGIEFLDKPFNAEVLLKKLHAMLPENAPANTV